MPPGMKYSVLPEAAYYVIPGKWHCGKGKRQNSSDGRKTLQGLEEREGEQVEHGGLGL